MDKKTTLLSPVLAAWLGVSGCAHKQPPHQHGGEAAHLPEQQVAPALPGHVADNAGTEAPASGMAEPLPDGHEHLEALHEPLDSGTVVDAANKAAPVIEDASAVPTVPVRKPATGNIRAARRVAPRPGPAATFDPDDADDAQFMLFANAIENADTATLLAIIADGGNANAANANGMTPLMAAARNNAPLETITVLLNAGANANARDLDGATPLLHAFLRGAKPPSAPLVARLIAAGADVNACDGNGGSILARAIALKTADPEILSILLDAGAGITIPTDQRDTAVRFTDLYMMQFDHMEGVNESPLRARLRQLTLDAIGQLKSTGLEDR